MPCAVKKLLTHSLALVHSNNLRVVCVQQAAQNAGPDDVESNNPVSSHISSMRRFVRLMMSQIFAQSCVLTFLAEWGDRSQISTIILAARDVSLAVVCLVAAIAWLLFLFVTSVVCYSLHRGYYHPQSSVCNSFGHFSLSVYVSVYV